MHAKKSLSGVPRYLFIPFQILLYTVIQIFFIPFALAGLVDGLYREFVKAKKLGVSYSAGQTLQYRWFMHYFGTRTDRLSVEFIKRFPCESHFGLWTLMGALIISQRLFGFTTGMSKIAEPGYETLSSTAGTRLLYFDRVMEKYINEIDQIVLPGAGFDLIALHFTKGKNIGVFEIDQADTVKIKIETLDRAGIDHEWISYIPVDYSSESWTEKLVDAGFDRTKKTLFLWQSVSHFLEAETVRNTLREMAGLCPVGSIVVQDFYSESFIFKNNSPAVKSQRNMMAKMGEPWKFGIDMSGNAETAVEDFLTACGLKMTEFFQFGKELRLEPFYCIVEAVKE